MKNEKKENTNEPQLAGEQAREFLKSASQKLFGTKKIAAITPEEAIAELKKKYPGDDVRQPDAKAEPKLEKPKKEKKPSVVQERVSYLQPLIESGQHTQTELVEKAVKKFPGLTESTIRTFLTDSKNPKYNKFEKLVVINDEGKLTFKK